MRLLKTIGSVDFTGQGRAALNKLTMPREGVGNLLVSNEERRELYARRCASRRLDPGELRANLLRMLSATVPNAPGGDR